MTTRPDLTAELIADVASFALDPLGFVKYAFPWGEPGQLTNETGPREWQAEILREIGDRLKAGQAAGDAVREAVQVAVASGHGIGKSALVSWLILWGLSTRENTRGIVTANTDTQLRTKTWPEVRKWFGMMLNRDWFNCAATSIHAKGEDEKVWRVDAIPWSDNNTEAFAGLHNKGSRVLVVFDEASAIADKIWEVTEGALTDEGTELIWCAFGNPTRNTGRFRECFGRLGHRWTHRQIDSRTVPGTNKSQIDKWIQDYGPDSDFVRVRVKGQFPRSGSVQFIASDVVEQAAKQEAACHIDDPLVLGVDVARFGDDESVIQPRKGRDARTFRARAFRGLDTMQLSAQVVAYRQDLERMGFPVHAIFVDETGVGAGVVDRLRQMGFTVQGVNNGAKPDRTSIDGELVANKGAECWAQMRSWAKTGGAIEDDQDLRQQMEGREYGYNSHNQIVLERKDDMRKRGLSSPDRADALSLTFAFPVVVRHQAGPAPRAITEYDPLAG